jgi:hypothetical protein
MACIDMKNSLTVAPTQAANEEAVQRRAVSSDSPFPAEDRDGAWGDGTDLILDLGYQE